MGRFTPRTVLAKRTVLIYRRRAINLRDRLRRAKAREAKVRQTRLPVLSRRRLAPGHGRQLTIIHCLNTLQLIRNDLNGFLHWRPSTKAERSNGESRKWVVCRPLRLSANTTDLLLADLRSHYLGLMRQVHPDRGGHLGLATEINHVYQTAVRLLKKF